MKTKLNLKDGFIGFDCEATGLDPWWDRKRWNGICPARPYAFSFCDTSYNTHYVRWQVDPKTRRVLIPKDGTFEWMQNEIFANPNIALVGHNISYDLRMAEMTGFRFNVKKVHDSLVMMHVVTGGSEMQYGLKYLGKKYLEIHDGDESELQEATIRARNKGKKLGWVLATKELFGKEPIKADYWMAPPELCKTYAVQDAIRTMMLFQMIKEDIETNKNMYHVYEREMKLFWVVKRMENRGVRVFPEDLTRLVKFYSDYMMDQRKKADENGGKDLNFKSHKQMHRVFIEERKHKALKFSDKTGNAKVDGEFLVQAAQKDPLAKAALEYNGAKHALSAFLSPYERYRVEESKGVWVLHPNFRQCGPVTGRFSCSDPNLMQVASETTGRRKTDITLRPREAFGPRPGCLWYLPDYSQIEVWLFSFLAQEKAMMAALLAGHDFHGAVSKQVWGKEPDFTDKASYYRKRAKLVLFCKLYGGGIKKTAFLLDCAVNEAAKFVGKFDEELPGIRRYMKTMISKAESEGQIVNPLGRTYFIQPNFAYRAVNYMIQGTAADIMKRTMINVDAYLRTEWPGCSLLLTLHDELVVEVPLKYHSLKLMKGIIFNMQRDSKLVGIPVPLPVSMKIAKERWSKTTDIKI